MPAPNADLEQSLFRANLKETRLRQRAILAVLLPVAIGAAWLIYSLVVVTHWQKQSREVAAREAALEKREVESRQQVADADARRAAAEGSVQAARDGEKVAKERAVEIEQQLVKVREAVGPLGTLLTDITAAKTTAAKLSASEAVEAQLSGIRATLGRTLTRIEQEIDKSLPPAEQKARVYLYITDEGQRAVAKALAPILERAGYDVADIAKSAVRRGDNIQILYFRDPVDKPEAARIQELVAKQTGQTDCKVTRGSDPDQGIGSRKFQVWLSKPPPVATGR